MTPPRNKKKEGAPPECRISNKIGGKPPPTVHTTLHTRAMTTTYEQLCAQAALEKIRIRQCRTTGDHDAYWDSQRRTIWIDDTIPEGSIYAACVLAHELEHARRGHNGHQGTLTENLIDEHVARQFVNPDTYKHLERIYGSLPGLIAEEMSLPVWVIHAWQRLLARTIRRAG